jgi:hypothetical protein
MRRPRCAYCRKAFTPRRRGRRPKYCSDAHRQRAHQERHALDRFPSLALGRDIDDMRTRDGIRRVVIDVLREFDILAPVPKRQPPIRIAVDNERERDDTPPVTKSERERRVSQGKCQS